MNRSRIILFMLGFFSSCVLSAQKERNHWYFGMLAGMEYDGTNYIDVTDNTIQRQIVFGQIEGPDNIICATDDDGDLMFYSDGRIFKNRLNQNLLNSATQEYAMWESQAAIARDPGNEDRYYVFVTIQDGIRKRLSYNIVDMTLDNGLGGLDPDNIHTLLNNNVTQHMVTARHANGRDMWLIVLREGQWLSYLITPSGISNTPVSSTAGINFFDVNETNFGVMEISPDNKLIAAGFPLFRRLFLLGFDDLTGRLELIYEEEEPSQSPGLAPFNAVEFSSNSKVLYTTYGGDGIQQYDISDPQNIPPRNTIVSGASNFPYLKRGPDGKIFVSRSGETMMPAIENPNVLGAGCNYNPAFINLTGNMLLDLPTFLLPKYPEGISFINICEGETTELNYNTSLVGATYLWDLGDGNTATGENVLHTYALPGTYQVSVEAYDSNNVLTFTDSRDLIIYDSPSINTPEDEYNCSENTPVFFVEKNDEILAGLDPSIFRVSYYFSEDDALKKDNEVIDYIPVAGTIEVWVRIENAQNLTCFEIKSYEIITPEFITIDIDTEQSICNGSDLTLQAPDGFISYEWSNGENTQNITITTPGIYTLNVVKDFGTFTCEAQTDIQVRIPDPPIIEDIIVNDWSRDHNSIEVVTSDEGNFEYSLDGISYQNSSIFNNLPLDEYRVFVRDIDCLQEASSDPLFLLFYDNFFTPNGDGFNDYWQIFNSKKEESIQILIYDRFGRLLHQLPYDDIGWDGTANGNPLPSSDYWFKVIRPNGKVHTGHFTLKR